MQNILNHEEFYEAKTSSNSTPFDQVLVAIGQNSADITTYAQFDDSLLRYSNPDVDNNGIVDLSEDKKYGLYFHNHFIAKTKEGHDLHMTDLINQYPPDDLQLSYAGASVMPQLPAENDEAEYSWLFEQDIVTNSCSPSFDQFITIPKGVPCTISPKDHVGTFSIYTEKLPHGIYKLSIGDRTLTWQRIGAVDVSC